MGGLALWHWVIVALVVLVLFGRGKISETMGDFGRGIKSFKKGLAEDEAPKPAAPPPPQIPAQTAANGTPAPTPASTGSDTPSQ